MITHIPRPDTKLQWGRSTSLRKTPYAAEPGPTCSRGFNGAAAHRCGKLHTCETSTTRLPLGFNGAAAHRCGKPQSAPLRSSGLTRASMGPQHIAAENVFTDTGGRIVWGRFNGAAAHRCGKHNADWVAAHNIARFNGAAAHRCGKHNADWVAAHNIARFNGAAAHRCGKPQRDRA